MSAAALAMRVIANPGGKTYVDALGVHCAHHS